MNDKEIAKFKAEMERLYKLNPRIFDEDYVPDGHCCVEAISNTTGEVISSHTFIPRENRFKVYSARVLKWLGFHRWSRKILNSIEVP